MGKFVFVSHGTPPVEDTDYHASGTTYYQALNFSIASRSLPLCSS